jgi:hypothetical protein
MNAAWLPVVMAWASGRGHEHAGDIQPAGHHPGLRQHQQADGRLRTIESGPAVLAGSAGAADQAPRGR